MEQATVHETQTESTQDSNERHGYDAARLTMAWPLPIVLPQGQPRRIYGVISDGPRKRKPRLFYY